MVNNKVPKTYQDALNILHQGTFQVINGGTDLMVRHRGWSETKVNFKKDMLYIKNLEELNYIKPNDDWIHIGATTTHETMLNSPVIPEILKKCLRLFASPAIRNMGTLAGNIGNASPAGDALLIAYLLDAIVVVESLEHRREVPIASFIKGPGKIALESHEMIKEVKFKNADFTFTTFTKVGGRQSDAISKVVFAGAVKLENKKITDIRIAIGSVSPKIIKDTALERSLKGYSINNLSNQKAMILTQYESQITPIDDQRSNKVYRKTVALNLIKEFLDAIIKRK